MTQSFDVEAAKQAYQHILDTSKIMFSTPILQNQETMDRIIEEMGLPSDAADSDSIFNYIVSILELIKRIQDWENPNEDDTLDISFSYNIGMLFFVLIFHKSEFQLGIKSDATKMLHEALPTLAGFYQVDPTVFQIVIALLERFNKHATLSYIHQVKGEDIHFETQGSVSDLKERLEDHFGESELLDRIYEGYIVALAYFYSLSDTAFKKEGQVHENVTVEFSIDHQGDFTNESLFFKGMRNHFSVMAAAYCTLYECAEDSYRVLGGIDSFHFSKRMLFEMEGELIVPELTFNSRRLPVAVDMHEYLEQKGFKEGPKRLCILPLF